MGRLWTVLDADTDAERVAIKGAGCTHAVIDASWSELQPSGPGALDPTAAAKLVADYAHARSIGLKPILALHLHYAPPWILSSIEPFKDQSGNSYLDTTIAAGKAVRNWMWTGLGRTRVSDLITRVAAALGPANVATTDGVRVGGGWYGELHYPESVGGGPTYAWQAFGASMQSGTDLAEGMTVCPVPGYTPYTGTDAQDCAFLNWYLNGLVDWSKWLVARYKAAGFTRNLWILLPGYGVRLNQQRSDGGYKQAAALGEDHIRAIGAHMHDPAVWFCSTFLNTADGFPGGVVDSDKSQWKSVWEKTEPRGKHFRLIGENTGGENNAGMDAIFTGALSNADYAGRPKPPTDTYYRGIAWLNIANLQAGGAHATLARLATDIAAAAV